MQLIFEPSAAAIAAERAKQDELDEMRVLATYEYRVEDKRSYREFLQTNLQLHTLIAQSTKNRRLSDVVSNIHIRLMRFFYLGLSFEPYGPTLVAEHISLVEAICKRDTGEARRMAAEHISKAIERSASLLMGAIRFGEVVFETDPESENSRLKTGVGLRRI
jgi:DNA-binding GntR family transcriptional regulator